jgi:hypothetical protein
MRIETEQGSFDPTYDTLDAWVTLHFLPMYMRTLGGEFRWCRAWSEHAEATSRLWTLWEAWELASHDTGSGAMVSWYHELDHHLPILLGARGPFFQCSEKEHIEPCVARSDPVTEEHWRIAFRREDR